MPRGRYQQQQWETRETAILDALETLATERGFAQVTMDDLADAVGISKATLYQHFDSKDMMLVSVMARHTQQFIDWLEQKLAEIGVCKFVPDDETLADAWHWVTKLRLLDAAISKIECSIEASNTEAPADLRSRLESALQDSSRAWDEALLNVASETDPSR